MKVSRVVALYRSDFDILLDILPGYADKIRALSSSGEKRNYPISSEFYEYAEFYDLSASCYDTAYAWLSYLLASIFDSIF